MLHIPEKIQRMREAGALFVINHSAGKDSQAMALLLEDWLGDYPHVAYVHADLGRIEWEGNVAHIEATKPEHRELHVVRAGKTFFDMVRRRAETRPDAPSWPSSSSRQCTSDLKRDPIAKWARSVAPYYGGKVVQCLGLRAEESPARAKKQVLKHNARESKAGREVWEWLPIHHLLVDEVFDTIREHHQEPHWAYAAGMSRLSCSFCILANSADLACAARLRPDLYQEYQQLERETGWTMFAKASLAERVDNHNAKVTR